MDKLVNSLMSSKEAWKGLKIRRACYKPKRYARKDRRGQFVPLNLRAQAACDCLAEDHWGIKSDPDWNEEVASEVREKMKARIRRGVL